MKLPNGYGSVSKVKGRRRKPFRVYVTVGWDEDGKQIKKSLGYVETIKKGLQELAKYHNDPFDLDFKNITFEDVWAEVVVELTDLVEKEKMSLSNLKGLTLAFKNHCKPLHKDKVLEIKYIKMQNLIDSLELSRSGKGYVRSVCVKVFNHAIDVYELPIVNNPAIRLRVGEYEQSNKHYPYTDWELEHMWDFVKEIKNGEWNDVIKIMIILNYTGMRPNELFDMKRENVFLDKDYMIGGSKTKAGKNRIIPIHPRIKYLLEYFMNLDDNKNPFRLRIKGFNYGKFYRRYLQVIDHDLSIHSHTPYDARHTFATRMKQANANEYLLKRILGHSIKDVTEKVYTHRDLQDLINEVLKIK